jgi:hypothetical protein
VRKRGGERVRKREREKERGRERKKEGERCRYGCFIFIFNRNDRYLGTF